MSWTTVFCQFSKQITLVAKITLLGRRTATFCLLYKVLYQLKQAYQRELSASHASGVLGFSISCKLLLQPAKTLLQHLMICLVSQILPTTKTGLICYDAVQQIPNFAVPLLN
jgi:hypothetical protein